jgi:hypothetical protein
VGGIEYLSNRGEFVLFVVQFQFDIRGHRLATRWLSAMKVVIARERNIRDSGAKRTAQGLDDCEQHRGLAASVWARKHCDRANTPHLVIEHKIQAINCPEISDSEPSNVHLPPKERHFEVRANSRQLSVRPVRLFYCCCVIFDKNVASTPGWGHPDRSRFRAKCSASTVRREARPHGRRDAEGFVQGHRAVVAVADGDLFAVQ